MDLGGAALNLFGIVERSTADVDILAMADAREAKHAGEAEPYPRHIQQPPEPLPAVLTEAARIVARDLNLPDDWLNSGPALQWRAGLPPGLEPRIQWRRYSALWVGLVDRYHLILFKLFAAADASGPRSVHYRDLVALRPTPAELSEAAAWVRKAGCVARVRHGS